MEMGGGKSHRAYQQEKGASSAKKKKKLGTQRGRGKGHKR